MKEFTVNGKTWKINLTLGAAKRVKDKLGVDLLNPTAGEEGNQPVYSRLIFDDIFLVTVVSVLIADQLKDAGITEDVFFESFDGASTKELSETFLEEYSSFFTARGRNYISKMIALQKETISNAGEEFVKNIQKSVGEMFANLQGAPDLQTGGN